MGRHGGGGRLLSFGCQLPPQLTVGRRPPGGVGGGGGLEGGSGRGDGGLREGRLGGGGSRWGDLGCFGGGGGTQASLTSPCPPSNHTITINLTLTFAASWFGHASHVDWAEQDPLNFVHRCFCHIILDPNTHSDPSLG